MTSILRRGVQAREGSGRVRLPTESSVRDAAKTILGREAKVTASSIAKELGLIGGKGTAAVTSVLEMRQQKIRKEFGIPE